ncbi:helix-turn-helix domain-containing protein [Flavobacterium aquiphilum]|uniref:helix-turn-helix domain-containing protein n=1 Tax=Flavobacterium aquiphilum TaxID=3003261 RepID=UPI00247FED70|nr:helix-turn-helix domain-containing protein [Flavobacterium aquiphilum]
MEAIQFIGTTPEALQQMIIDSMRELLRVKEDEVLLTQQEVADFYKVTTQTIIKWQTAGIIKAYGIASERRYKKSELMDNLIQLK